MNACTSARAAKEPGAAGKEATVGAVAVAGKVGGRESDGVGGVTTVRGLFAEAIALSSRAITVGAGITQAFNNRATLTQHNILMTRIVLSIETGYWLSQRRLE